MKNEKMFSTEKNNKKKGLRYSVYFHSALILLALIPFLTKDIAKDDTKFENVIEVDFSKLDAAAQQSSTTKSNSEVEKTKKNTATKVVKQPVPVPKPPTPVEVKKTETKPTPKAPTPVVTETVEEESPVEALPTPPEPEVVEIPETKPVDVPPTPKVEAPTPTPPATPEVAEEETGSSTEGTDEADVAIGQGDSSNGGAGESEAGTGKGTAAEGDGDGDHGSGILNRRVVYRADVKDITQEEGVIVVNICVNNDGRVVMAKYNSDASSIQDMDLVRRAIQTARKYRFEKDYKVPAKQCGQLSFRFEIEEEG